LDNQQRVLIFISVFNQQSDKYYQIFSSIRLQLQSCVELVKRALRDNKGDII